MKILYATPFVPYPPTYGGTIIPYRHLKGLAERGHRIVMVLPLRRPGDPDNLEPLRAFGTVRAVPTTNSSMLGIVGEALPHGASLRITRHRFSAVEREVARAIREDGPFDVVYLDTVFTAYLLPVVRAEAPRTPVVLLELNVESQVFDRWTAQRGGPTLAFLARWEAPRIARAEREAHRELERVVTLSEEDARTIRTGAPEARTFVLGPGTPTYAGEAIPPPPDRRTVLFFGSYHWPPNADGAEWMAKHIWPRVLERAPDARLVLAGLDPKGSITRLADPARHIETPGFVDDAVATTRSATVCTVPLRVGGGIRLKIIEALANDRPVMTTTIGAEGLGLTPGVHAHFADDEDAFAAGVVQLLHDETQARRLAGEGRRLVEERFAWPKIVDRLESLLGEVVAEGRRSR